MEENPENYNEIDTKNLKKKEEREREKFIPPSCKIANSIKAPKSQMRQISSGLKGKNFEWKFNSVEIWRCLKWKDKRERGCERGGER